MKEGGGEKAIYSYNAFNDLLSNSTVGYKRSSKIYVSAAVWFRFFDFSFSFDSSEELVGAQLWKAWDPSLKVFTVQLVCT